MWHARLLDTLGLQTHPQFLPIAVSLKKISLLMLFEE